MHTVRGKWPPATRLSRPEWSPKATLGAAAALQGRVEPPCSLEQPPASRQTAVGVRARWALGYEKPGRGEEMKNGCGSTRGGGSGLGRGGSHLPVAAGLGELEWRHAGVVEDARGSPSCQPWCTHTMVRVRWWGRHRFEAVRCGFWHTMRLYGDDSAALVAVAMKSGWPWCARLHR